MTDSKYHYLFGPVRSRRLGLSLGVDILPMKTCTQNCLYCQLGKDAPLTLERKVYVPTEAVLDEVRRRVEEGLTADFMTLSGSGEPTLHSDLGQIIDGIKKLTSIPVAIITNGTLLYQPEVRYQCAKADVVMPSLDAGDEETFARLNNPHPELNFEVFVNGLCSFRREYAGQIWLEVFFCRGINTDEKSIQNLARLIEKIQPDKVQLNTVVRPTTHTEALPVPFDELGKIAQKLHPNSEIIADFSRHSTTPGLAKDTHYADAILAMLRRHPCSLEDICAGLSARMDQIRPVVNELLKTGQILSDSRSGNVCYKIS
jgi:wyosine [tRNA(Phe)-imidazoG37] synthetase (radical SAM superfamily)